MTPQDEFRQGLDEIKRQPELLVRNWAQYTPAQQRQIGPHVAAAVDQVGDAVLDALDRQEQFWAAMHERLARLEKGPQGIPPGALLETRSMPSTIETVSVNQRLIGLKIMPWDKVAETAEGPEMFRRGAFAGTVVEDVRLRMEHRDVTGKGVRYWEDSQYAFMEFRVAKTGRGDEQLQLAREGVTVGASIGFRRLPGGTEYGPRTADGRPLIVRNRVELREVSTTWIPVYADAGVMYVRSR